MGNSENIASRWTPPPRPEWVKTLNQAGANFGPHGPQMVIPLDEGSLIAAAISATGLDDFGDDDWRVPFRLLLQDLNEGDMNTAGRLLSRVDILQSLVARLKMTETEKQHPEILEQEIIKPIFITGLGRTGTTILLELLGQDPNLRAAMGWEFRYPSPPPEADKRHNDPRIAMTQADVDLWSAVLPEFNAIHEVVVDDPEADSVSMRHEFTSPMWSATQKSPRYDAWMANDRLAQALRFHRRALKHLQWKTPGQWILKFPSYLTNLPSLFKEFSDAKVIVTHRDPIKVMASSANMLATLRWQRSDHVNFEELASPIVQGFPMLLDMVSQQRQSGIVPKAQMFDIHYAELIGNQQAAIRKLYEQLGIEFTAEAEQRMKAYVAAKPKHRHGVHSYRFEDLGADHDEMRAKFAGYMQEYTVPVEKL